MTRFSTTRKIPASPEQVFAAIGDPVRLARWWGPAGFTNTFTRFEFREGGRWSFVMHGPDGSDYPNESTFVEISAAQKVVIQHVCEPVFRLTIGLAAVPDGTVVSWDQDFESAEVAARVSHIVEPANEQNLDRLTNVVLQDRGND